MTYRKHRADRSRRPGLLKELECARYFHFKLPKALFQIPAAFAVHTSAHLAEVLSDTVRQRHHTHTQTQSTNTAQPEHQFIIEIEVDPDFPPYLLGRLIEHWYTLSLTVVQNKPVRHAKCLPSDRAALDVTDTMSTIEALFRLWEAGHGLRDQHLIDQALSSMRHRVVQGDFEASDIVKYLIQAYTSDQLGDEEMKKLMLTAALKMRSGPVTDEMIEVLKEDWYRGKEWVDRMEADGHGW
jgi:hypothetical protein